MKQITIHSSRQFNKNSLDDNDIEEIQTLIINDDDFISFITDMTKKKSRHKRFYYYDEFAHSEIPAESGLQIPPIKIYHGKKLLCTASEALKLGIAIDIDEFNAYIVDASECFDCFIDEWAEDNEYVEIPKRSKYKVTTDAIVEALTNL